MRYRLHLVTGLAAAAAALLAGCGSTDVVAKFAASSFSAIAAASKDRVSYDAEDGAWRLASPAGDVVALSADFSRKPADASADPLMEAPDVELEFDLAPLAAAGLDPGRLPMQMPGAKVAYAVEDGIFMVHAELGDESFPPEAAKSIEAAFAAILRTHRASVGYHEKLDHYGIKLGGGNMFEWAKDPAKNDKDIVFVLDPAPLLAAGLDPARLAGGWVFAKVESKDAGGKTVIEDKLLKPFDLR